MTELNALARLDPNDRDLLAMRYLAGFDGTELAIATGTKRFRYEGSLAQWPAPTSNERSPLVEDCDAAPLQLSAIRALCCCLVLDSPLVRLSMNSSCEFSIGYS
jgi:hypothetical protein